MLPDVSSLDDYETAKRLGRKYYKKICNRGHWVRLTKTKYCVTCRKEADAKKYRKVKYIHGPGSKMIAIDHKKSEYSFINDYYRM